MQINDLYKLFFQTKLQMNDLYKLFPKQVTVNDLYNLWHDKHN